MNAEGRADEQTTIGSWLVEHLYLDCGTCESLVRDEIQTMNVIYWMIDGARTADTAVKHTPDELLEPPKPRCIPSTSSAIASQSCDHALPEDDGYVLAQTMV